MKNLSFFVFTLSLFTAFSCTKREEVKTPAQIISSAFSIDKVADFETLDILVVNKEEYVNEVSAIPDRYELFMQFSQNGTGHDSQLSVQGQTLVVKQSGNYFEPTVTHDGNNKLLVDYIKSSANSTVGDFTLSTSKHSNLEAKASFNLEFGLNKTQDVNITWTPDLVNQDGKIYIALCVGGVPCQFYESTDQGSFIIPQAKLADFVKGRSGNICVTRVLTSDVLTSNGEKLKLLNTTSALSFSFKIL
jgi:hypothetical protein